MPDVSVRFVHPTDGRQISVTLDDTMTVEEVVSELVANGFVKPSAQGYNLAPKGGDMITPNSLSLSQGGVHDGDTVRVIPATDAG